MHAPTGGVAKPSTAASAISAPSGAPAGRAAIAASAAAATSALPSRTRRLAAAVDEAPERRTAGALGDGERAGDESGGGEGVGEALDVDEHPDREHRQRQAGDDRGGEDG